MCGRLNQFAQVPELSLAGRVLKIEKRPRKSKEDRRSGATAIYNLCPTDYADVLRMDDGLPVLERMRFGLIPSWAKGTKAEVEKKFRLTFNARSETVFELASYRSPIKRQRCLVPVRGWHEWPERGTPYYIHRRDDKPLLLAGIWDVWESPHLQDEESGPVITSMSVVTTPPGRYMAKFHDRSPLILEDEEALSWMQPGLQREDLQAMFKPCESEFLEAYRVSPAASNARNKTEEVIRPVAPPVHHEGDAPVENEEPTTPDLKLFF